MKKKFLTVLIIAVMLMQTVCNAARVTVYRTASSDGYEVTTPQQYVFRPDGTEVDFILLDELEDGYLVMMKMYAAVRWPFDPDDTGKFDIEDENNIAWWLNNDYLDKNIDGVTPLPECVKKYLVEHEWVTEAGNENTDFKEDYTTKCKVVLPSLTEWLKYLYNGKKIGSYDDTRNAFWMLRSTDGTNTTLSDPYLSGIIVATYTGITGWGKAVTGCGVRPMFVLDKGFFETEKVEIKRTGGVVLQTIAEQLGEERLAALYGDTRIVEKMNKYIKPIAKNVKYIGITVVGRTLTGSYEYYSPNQTAEGKTVYRWLRSNEKNGVYTPIRGATGRSYVPTKADENKYICFEVIPKTAINIGSAVRSVAWKISPETVPVISSVEIMGDAHNDSVLYADYHTYEGNNEPLSNVYFRWQTSEDGTNFIDIPNEANASFTPGAEYCGKYVRVSVQGEKMGDGSYLKGEAAFSDKLLITSKPLAENVTADGTDTLYGTYTYSEPLNISEGESICLWEASPKDKSDFRIIGYGSSIKTPAVADDCLLRFSVIPVNKDGAAGEKVSSEPISVSGTVFSKAQEKTVSGTNARITLSRAGYYSGMIIKLTSDNEKLSFSGDLFDVMPYRTGNQYIIALKAKNADAVYADGAILTVSAESASGSITVENVYANDVTSSAGPENITDFAGIRQQ